MTTEAARRGRKKPGTSTVPTVCPRMSSSAMTTVPSSAIRVASLTTTRPSSIIRAACSAPGSLVARIVSASMTSTSPPSHQGSAYPAV